MLDELFDKANPEDIIKSLDKMTDKYHWGDFAHPLVILRLLRKALGYEWGDWEPKTLISHVEKEFGDIDELTMNKILALQTALASDTPWQDFDVFENTCLAFANEIPIWGAIQPVDLHEIAFGCGILDAIRDEEYSDEVKGYVAGTLLYNGVICQPPNSPLPDVQQGLKLNLDDEGRKLADFFIKQWMQGYRKKDNLDDPLQVQISKLLDIEYWYAVGRES